MAQIVVNVKAGSRKPGISIVGTTIEVRVSQPAQDGRANEAVRESLASALGVPPIRLRLERGARSREKAFSVEGLDRETVFARLRERSLPASRPKTSG